MLGELEQSASEKGQILIGRTWLVQSKAIHIIAMLTKIHVKFEAVIRTLLPLETDHGFDQDQTMGRCPYLKCIASRVYYIWIYWYIILSWYAYVHSYLCLTLLHTICMPAVSTGIHYSVHWRNTYSARSWKLAKQTLQSAIGKSNELYMPCIIVSTNLYL